MLVGEPHVAEFDFAARIAERDGLGIAGDGDGLVEQAENALGSRHGGLQNVEFFAQVLDGPEETLRVLHESDEHADG